MYIYNPAAAVAESAQGINDVAGTLGLHVLKRQSSSSSTSSNNPAPVYMVSTMQKTVIPIVISLVLFFLVFLVLFFIVRKKRIQNKANEAAEYRRKRLEGLDNDADEDFELSPPRQYQPRVYPRTASLPVKTDPEITVTPPAPADVYTPEDKSKRHVLTSTERDGARETEFV